MTPLFQRRRIRFGPLALLGALACMLARSTAAPGAEVEIRLPGDVFVHEAYLSIDWLGIWLLVGAVLILIAGGTTGVVLSLRQSRKH